MTRTIAKSPVPSMLYKAADAIEAGADPADALAPFRAHMWRLKEAGEVTHSVDDGLAWLDAAAKVCRALGLTDEAGELVESAQAIREGAIVPSRRFYWWVDAASAAGRPSKARTPAPAQQPIDLNLNVNVTGPMGIGSLPTRSGRIRVERDKDGRISGAVHVEEDVE